MTLTYSGDDYLGKKRVGFIKKILKSSLFPYTFSGLSVLIDEHQKEPRGQIRGREMKLALGIKADAEFVKLFTHELGHFVDIILLHGDTTHADPSLIFYNISWESPKVKRPSAKLSAFVSGYAATNQYEDFAESFVWYIFHNNDFLDKAMKNEQMREKYLFFTDIVFPNTEFIGTDFTLGDMPKYLWDTTKVPILFQKYLYFLQ